MDLSQTNRLEIVEICRPDGLARGHGLLRVVLSEARTELAVLRKFIEARCPWSRVNFESKANYSSGHTLSALRARRARNSFPYHAQWRKDLPGWFVVEGGRLSRFATLRLFKHGVMLEEIVLTGHIGPTVSLCADHLKTDLSGLKFIHDQSYRDAVERGRELLSSNLLLPSPANPLIHHLTVTRAFYLSGLLVALSVLI